MGGEHDAGSVGPGYGVVHAPPAGADQGHVEAQHERYWDEVPEGGAVQTHLFEDPVRKGR